MLPGVSKINESARNSYFLSVAKKPLGGGFRFYELFSGRKVMEGAGRKVRGKERPRPWAPHLTRNAVALLGQKKGIRTYVFRRHRQHPNTVKKGETREALCARCQGSATPGGSAGSRWVCGTWRQAEPCGQNRRSVPARSSDASSSPSVPVSQNVSLTPPKQLLPEVPAFCGTVRSAILHSPVTCPCRTNRALP